MAEKYTHRFPPCPSYDIEGFESWLEDMAENGLILDHDPFFGGFATFRKEHPAAIRYRLQPKPKQAGMFSKRNPQQDAIDLAKEYGWTYLGEHTDFFIFCTDDPNVPELDTDPHVQAIGLQELRKRKRSSLISHLSLLVLYVGLLVWDGPVRFLLDQRSWYVLLLFAIWLIYGLLSLREFRYLDYYQTQLLLGDQLSRKKDWKGRRWAHWITALLSIPLVLLFLIGAFGSRFIDWEDRLWQPRTEPLPFASAEDLYPGSTFIPDEVWVIEEVDHVAARSTWLADCQIKLSQNGSLQPSGADLFLRAEYYDLKTQWLAEELYDELLQTAQREKYYEARTVTDLPTAQETAWQDVVSTCVLLQEGETVLLAELSQYGDDTLPLDTWAEIFADSIKE